MSPSISGTIPCVGGFPLALVICGPLASNGPEGSGRSPHAFAVAAVTMYMLNGGCCRGGGADRFRSSYPRRSTRSNSLTPTQTSPSCSL